MDLFFFKDGNEDEDVGAQIWFHRKLIQGCAGGGLNFRKAKPLHNLGGWLKKIREASKIRRAHQTGLHSSDELAEFVQQLVRLHPKVLKLPWGMAERHNGRLMGLKLGDHPDFSKCRDLCFEILGMIESVHSLFFMRF